MKTTAFVASLIALAFTAGAASALTIKNQDSTDYTVKVLPQGGKEASVTVHSGQSSTVDCPKGCKLSLGTVNDNVDGKTKAIAIKDGKFAAM